MSLNGYPPTLDTDNTIQILVNNWSTTLSVGCTNADTTIHLTTVVNLPSQGILTFTDNAEIIHYTGISGNDITGCTRGYDSSSATSHLSGCGIEMRWIARLHNYIKDTIIGMEGAIDLKAPIASPTFTETVTIPTPFNLGATSVTPTGIELNYVGGVTSAIQTQLNAKIAKALLTEQGSIIYASAVSTPAELLHGTAGQVLQSGGHAANPSWLTLGTMASQAANNVAITGGSIGGITDLPIADGGTGASVAATAFDNLKQVATQSYNGVLELATAAEINTGTDTTRTMPIDQFVASNRNVRYILYRVLDPSTSHTVLTTVGGDLEIPITGTIVEIGAYVDTAGVTNLATIDVHLNGTTIMTTNKITIDSAEKSSRTAATQPALTTTAVTAGNLITVDIDAIQTTAAKGLTIRLGIRMT